MRTITAVSRLTGLSPYTLRAWEKRYAVVSPQRDPNGHRLYGPDEVRRLRHLAAVVDRGYLINKVARLSNEELTELIGEETSPSAPRHAIELCELLLDTVTEHRFAEINELLDMAAVCLSPGELIEHVILPVMREVGERWECGDLAIGQEHAISECISGALHQLYRRIRRVSQRPSLVLATLSGERHGTGALAAAYFATTRGVQAHYLGTDLPPTDIAATAERAGAAVVCLSINYADGYSHDYAAQLKVLRSRLPDHIEIWLGGRKMADKTLRLPANCQIMRSLTDFERRLQLIQPRRAHQKRAGT